MKSGSFLISNSPSLMTEDQLNSLVCSLISQADDKRFDSYGPISQEVIIKRAEILFHTNNIQFKKAIDQGLMENNKQCLFLLAMICPKTFRTIDFYNKQIGLFSLAAAAQKGYTEAILEVLKRGKNIFHANDFTVEIRPGQNILCLLSMTACKGHTEPLLRVLELYKDDFKASDLIERIGGPSSTCPAPWELLSKFLEHGKSEKLRLILEQIIKKENDSSCQDEAKVGLNQLKRQHQPQYESQNIINSNSTSGVIEIPPEENPISIPTNSLSLVELFEMAMHSADQERAYISNLRNDVTIFPNLLNSIAPGAERQNLIAQFSAICAKNPKYINSVIKRCKFNAEDLIGEIQEGACKGTNLLQQLAIMAVNGKRGAFVTAIRLFKHYLDINHFKVTIQEGRYKGLNILQTICLANIYGYPLPSITVWNTFNKELTASDFTQKIQEGRFQGLSALHFLCAGDHNTNDSTLINVLQKYRGSFCAEEFVAKRGVYIKVNALTFLVNKAVHGNGKALIMVLKQYNFTAEDFMTHYLFLKENGGHPETLWSILKSSSNHHHSIRECVNIVSKIIGYESDYNTSKNNKINPSPQSPDCIIIDDLSSDSLGASEVVCELPPEEIAALQSYEIIQNINNLHSQSYSQNNQQGYGASTDTILDDEEIIIIEENLSLESESNSTPLSLDDVIERDEEIQNISGGIANKYLREEHRTNLNIPQALSVTNRNNSQSFDSLIVDCISLKLFSMQQHKTSVTHHRQEVQVADSRFEFYSHNPEIKQNVPCVFIMAGRKDNAHFLKPSAGVRTILVFSKNDLKELSYPIPAELDYLVIENLNSSSHGKFKEDELGLITARRVAAFLFSYHFSVEYAIVCDDNVSKFELSKQAVFSDSTSVYKALIGTLNNSLSVSVPTISTKPKQQATQKNHLGSKIFVYNMNAIRNIFTSAKSMFYLLPPSTCVRWWGEDYLMQCMLHQASSNQGFRILLREEFGGLHRLMQHKNSCKKMVSTAEDYLEKEDVFLSGIDFSKIEDHFATAIKNSLKTLKSIVRERIEIVEQRNLYLKGLNIEAVHAEANNIKLHNATDPKRFLNLNTNHAFKKAREELDFINDILFKHQSMALAKLFAVKPVKANGHLSMCPAAGKTRVQVAFSHLCATKVKRPIFIIAPTKELVHQTYNEFMRTYNDFSKCLKGALLKQEIIKVSSAANDLSQGLLSKHHAQNKNVFIFCEESYKLFMSSNRYFTPSVVIFDEFHDIASETIDESIQKIDQEIFVPVIGLSATPNCKKHPSLSNRIFSYSREEALEDKRVAPIIIDYFKEEYSKAFYQQLLNDMPYILQNYFHPNGKLLCHSKSIIFVRSIDDANELSKAIEKIGIKAFSIHSGNENNFIDQFKSCSVAVAVAVRQMRVGFDDPSVYAVLNLQKPINGDLFFQAGCRAVRSFKSDPHKIGWVVTYRNANTSNFRVTTDTQAIMAANIVYKTKQRAINSAKTCCKNLKDILPKIKELAQGKALIFQVKITMLRFNMVLEDIADKYLAYWEACKKGLKDNYSKPERKQLRNSDSFLFSMRLLINELIPENRYIFIQMQEREKPTNALTLQFCNSVSQMHENLKTIKKSSLIQTNECINKRENELQLGMQNKNN